MKIILEHESEIENADGSREVLGEVPTRPVRGGSIVQVKGINYRAVKYTVTESEVSLVIREGNVHPCATPDYSFNEQELVTDKHEYIVMTGATDDRVSKVIIDGQPEVDDILLHDGKRYRVVDWCIGMRKTDEIYVEFVELTDEENEYRRAGDVD